MDHAPLSPPSCARSPRALFLAPPSSWGSAPQGVASAGSCQRPCSGFVDVKGDAPRGAVDVMTDRHRQDRRRRVHLALHRARARTVVIAGPPLHVHFGSEYDDDFLPSTSSAPWRAPPGVRLRHHEVATDPEPANPTTGAAGTACSRPTGRPSKDVIEVVAPKRCPHLTSTTSIHPPMRNPRRDRRLRSFHREQPLIQGPVSARVAPRAIGAAPRASTEPGQPVPVHGDEAAHPRRVGAGVLAQGPADRLAHPEVASSRRASISVIAGGRGRSASGGRPAQITDAAPQPQVVVDRPTRAGSG